MPTRKQAVLVIDDDIRILRMMQRTLELEGYRVAVATDGEAAINMLAEETPALVLLDVMLPGMDGYAVCQRIREFSRVPIIMVTAKGDEKERIEGLNIGADDYVPKPFSSSELVARVRAVLRRTGVWDECKEPAFYSGDLVIDPAQHKVILRGQELILTATEYKLLAYLVRNAGCIVTPDQILEKVWGEEYVGETHLLQVTMARLRRKLQDDAKSPRYISTRPGIGYMMLKPA